jgi:predicted NAD/FAD-dependent oxidoreductase
MKKKIAIIGAGFCGLTLARELSAHADVHVFEKARGVGGRMSTRYAEQFFTARNKRFQEFLAPYIASGDVAEWKGKTIIFEAGKEPDKNIWFEPHYVAAPNMNSLCKKLAEGCSIALNTEIAPVEEKQKEKWQLVDKNGASVGAFDWIISTAPPVQTMRLFMGHIPATAGLSQVELQGCYALMIGFLKPWDKNWIAAKIRENPLQWIAINSTKPNRNTEITSIVAHSSNAWAEAHIDDDMGQAQAFLLQQFEAITGIDCGKADYLSTHRWRYALVNEPQEFLPYMDEVSGLASASDWCTTSRIEEVWLNATKLAQALCKKL